MSTIFDLESINDKDLSETLGDANKAAHLARFAVEGLMVKNTHSLIDAADLNLVQECIYTAEANVWHALTLHEDEVRARSVIHPPLNEPVTHGERVADCPVCGAAIMGQNGKDGWEADTYRCDHCEAVMHEPCYLGRVVTLADFQEYRRQVNGGDENYAPDVVCAQCRAKGE